MNLIQLPGLLGEQLFNSFDLASTDNIESREFVSGILTLYKANTRKVLELLFNLFDFNRNGFISAEDVSFLLNHLPSKCLRCHQTLRRFPDKENAVREFFCEYDYLGFEEFTEIVEQNLELMEVVLQGILSGIPEVVDECLELGNQPQEPIPMKYRGKQYFCILKAGCLFYSTSVDLSNPKGLTIWEAQFGDFSNGCQVMIDQFIASGETKWGRYSGLVMLLPHGYEGQGPEHSSARLERYLQLCAMANMQVMNITTPANLFHAFRRQLKTDYRKPLVIMSPKSLLRHPLCVSTTEEFTKGGFKELIDDDYVDAKKVKRVNICSGKIYYDLLAKQQEDKRTDVAIVRLEQIYPMPEKQMEALMKKYKNAEFCWVQEEPKNMGAWMHILRYDWARSFKEITRRSSASPATGYASVHKKEQEAIIAEAFDV